MSLLPSKAALNQSLRNFDRRSLLVRRKLKRKLGILDPLRLDVYIAFAGPQRAIVRGRALEDELPSAPRPDDSPLDNLKRALRQLESDEVPGLHLSVTLGAQTEDVVTDDEGYFYAEFALPAPLPEGWHSVSARVNEQAEEIKDSTEGEGSVLVPSPSARFGVISDIDDTILQTHVRSRLRMVYLTLFGNAVTRLSFEGTAELYRGLERAGPKAPFFYVSRSAWNIHPLLEHFIAHQGLPRGPLVLRDAALLTYQQQSQGHKRREIQRIFDTYPDLPFVLIGDSGQHDPEIYSEIARQTPDRMRAILIRNVSSAKEAQRTRQALHTACGSICPTCVFDDCTEAQALLSSEGLWCAEAESRSQ